MNAKTTYGIGVEQGRFYLNRINGDNDVTRLAEYDTQREAQIAAMHKRIEDGCDPLSGQPLRYCGGEVRTTFLGAACTGCGKAVVLTDDGDWAHV